MEIEGAHILITGGTGSFGHKVAQRLLDRHPREITIFSRDEKKQVDMMREFPMLRYALGDVRDYERLLEVMKGVDVVFHAAALKQVPNCEIWPVEALKTNALGAYNLSRAAVERGVRSVVALSTDKAVKPVNAMGMTKALMEKVVGQFGRENSGTVFSCVRYGNVMGSRGSIVPLYLAMISRGEPLPVTVPEMTRFMLTLDEAVSLVFHAMENASGGEVFVRKAPACTVDLLARVMINKYGGGRTIQTKVIGMRVGEKMHEVLVNEYEMLRAIERGEFYVILPQREGDDPSRATDGRGEYCSNTTRQIVDAEELGALLDRVIPDME